MPLTHIVRQVRDAEDDGKGGPRRTTQAKDTARGTHLERKAGQRNGKLQAAIGAFLRAFTWLEGRRIGRCKRRARKRICGRLFLTPDDIV